MKKELTLLDVYKTKGRVGGESSKQYLTILDHSAVIETDCIQSVVETYFGEGTDDKGMLEIKSFLFKNKLKMVSILFKNGGKLCNVLLPIDKPLISFFD